MTHIHVRELQVTHSSKNSQFRSEEKGDTSSSTISSPATAVNNMQGS